MDDRTTNNGPSGPPTADDPLRDPSTQLEHTDLIGALPSGQSTVNPYASPATIATGDQGDITLSWQELRTTRTGLLSMYYGICATLAASIGFFIFALVGAAIGLTFLPALFGLVAGFGGYVATLIGQLLCLTVPVASGCRRYAQLSVCLHILAVALSISSSLYLLNPSLESGGAQTTSRTASGIANLLATLSPLATMASIILFLFFLKKLCLYIKRDDLSKRAAKIIQRLSIILLWIVGLSIYQIRPLFNFLTAEVNTMIVAGSMVLVVVTSFATFIIFANLLSYVGRAIRIE